MSVQNLLPWLLEAAEAEAPPAVSADNRAAHIVYGDDPYADAGYGIPKNGIRLWQYEEQSSKPPCSPCRCRSRAARSLGLAARLAAQTPSGGVGH